MKKKLFLMAYLAVWGVQMSNAQSGTIALHHEGKVTIYDSGNIQSAVDASVKGDTLYLSEGTFGGFTITKGAVVIGSGQSTLISGDITISGNGTEENDGFVFSLMKLTGDFVTKGSINGLIIKQCNFNSFFPGESGENTLTLLDNAQIINCYASHITAIVSSVKKLYVYSCKIDVADATLAFGCVSFVNCNISQYRRNAYCENCIVNSRYSFVGTLKNCLYKDDGGTRVDCYKDESWSFNDLDCSLTNEELATKGYYGTDGTIVGCYGGTSPFSLIPATPHIKEHSLEVDELGTTLKVTLKIGTE